MVTDSARAYACSWRNKYLVSSLSFGWLRAVWRRRAFNIKKMHSQHRIWSNTVFKTVVCGAALSFNRLHNSGSDFDRYFYSSSCITGPNCIWKQSLTDLHDIFSLAVRVLRIWILFRSADGRLCIPQDGCEQWETEREWRWVPESNSHSQPQCSFSTVKSWCTAAIVVSTSLFPIILCGQQ